jgi:hypothetical protein
MTLVTVTSIFTPGSLPLSVIVDPTVAGLLLLGVLLGVLDVGGALEEGGAAWPVVTVWAVHPASATASTAAAKKGARIPGGWSLLIWSSACLLVK